MRQNIILAMGLAVLSTFGFASSDTVSKLLFRQGLNYDILSYSVLVFTFAAIMVATIGVASSGLAFLKPGKNATWIAIRALLSMCTVMLLLYLVKVLPLDILYSIMFLSPTMSGILAVILLREHFNRVRLLSLIIGLAGVLIITNPFSGSSNIAATSILLALILALFVALSGIVTRKYLKEINMVTLAFYNYLIAIVVLGLINVIFSLNTFIYTVEMIFTFKYIWFAFGAAAFTLLGFFSYNRAYQIGTVQILAPLNYLTLLWGILYGVVLFNNTSTVVTIIGAIVIIFSSTLIMFEKKILNLNLPLKKN